MKHQRLLAALGGLVIAGVLVGILTQHRQLALLRDAIQSSAHNALSPRQSEATPSPSTPLPLSDAEHRELLTLRRDVGQLRREKPDLDRLKSQNQRLRMAAAKASARNPDGSPSEPAYLSGANARFVGLATPAETLQSFLFAARRRDTNALFQVLTPESAGNLAAQIGSNGTYSMLNQIAAFPGFRIKAIRELPNGTVEADLQFDPRSDDDATVKKLTLERINGEWRLQL